MDLWDSSHRLRQAATEASTNSGPPERSGVSLSGPELSEGVTCPLLTQRPTTDLARCSARQYSEPEWGNCIRNAKRLNRSAQRWTIVAGQRHFAVPGELLRMNATAG